ncbi:MAG TPA: FAD-binding oxidoreductase [Longimicrobiales bacterium]|nr:FAD-binding oxidoreductase [Longimicrobiales bacterium]
MSAGRVSSESVTTTLQRLMGEEAVVAPEALSSWTVGGAQPLAVGVPSSVEEVQALMRLAASEGLGVVPLGGRTDVGCEPPSGRFVALATHRLGGVHDYEPADLTVTAGAGVTLEALGATLAARGQWLPVDPPFAPRRTLGGLVATGAAGPLGTAYGGPRDHVLGLTVVTGDGQVLQLGGKVMKNVAGFDLVKLMVGSRGTLGVIVSASVRLFPRPEADRLLVASADEPGPLLSLALAVATGSVVPASAVLMSPGAVPGVGAVLAVRLQGATESVSAETARLPANGPAFRQASPEEADELRKRMRDGAATQPVVVRASSLPGQLPELLDAVKAALPRGDLVVDALAGGVRCGMPLEGADADALTKLRLRVETMGGSVTLERAPPDLVMRVPAYGPVGRAGALEAELRRRFDPGGVLSPGRFVR